MPQNFSSSLRISSCSDGGILVICAMHLVLTKSRCIKRVLGLIKESNATAFAGMDVSLKASNVNNLRFLFVWANDSSSPPMKSRRLAEVFAGPSSSEPAPSGDSCASRIACKIWLTLESTPSVLVVASESFASVRGRIEWMAHPSWQSGHKQGPLNPTKWCDSSTV